MKIRPFFRWQDFYFGFRWCASTRTLDWLIVPMLGIRIDFRPHFRSNFEENRPYFCSRCGRVHLEHGEGGEAGERGACPTPPAVVAGA